MLDHILGRPSPSIRRTQIFLVIFFWIWRLYKGDGSAMRRPMSGWRRPISDTRVFQYRTAQQRAWWKRLLTFLFARKKGSLWMTNVNERLKFLTPYQLILGTLTVSYALGHLDDLLGFGAPEPLASLYSRSFYRATYINTALDAGFASAMTIRPKWVKDIASLVFGAYYLVFASAGDELLRRYRATCSVEMLRTTWEKTMNPYIRFATMHHRAKLPLVKHFVIERPKRSPRSRLPPVKAVLFYSGSAEDLEQCTEIVIDFPGGGFIAMGPEHHEERLRIWAKRTGKPVLSINYGKAPEYPYPWAIEEGIDAYWTIMEEKGRNLGIKSGKLGAVLTGDSAGGNICTTIMNRILEHHKHLPKPVAIILAYPALDFNFTSWMSPSHLRVLQSEQSEVNIPGLLEGKDHLRHAAPLSVVDDVKPRRPSHRSRKSWTDAFGGGFGMTLTPASDRRSRSASRTRSKTPTPISAKSSGTKTQPCSPVIGKRSLSRSNSVAGRIAAWFTPHEDGAADDSSEEQLSEASSDEDSDHRRDADKSLAERVKTPGVLADERFFGTEGILTVSPEPKQPEEMVIQTATKLGTRLTMTSRVGYFQDRIISPSMMRAMAILYIGPQRLPDFQTDYYISPILSPPHLLAHFPPVYVICGERDPFVDDTVIFAGKLREAKRARRKEAEATANADVSTPGKHGEGLRMSTGSNAVSAPDHILRESEEDWVQMRIIEGWGHGFMQMTALMREVETVLHEMADWISESFERAKLTRQDEESVAAAHLAVRTDVGPVATVDTMVSPLRSRHVRPSREYKRNPEGQRLGGADLGSGLGLDTDDEGTITFTPKKFKRTPPPSQFQPVPRRASKESLTRSNSAPRFDTDDSGSSENTALYTPPPMYAAPRSFGLFSRPQAPKHTNERSSPATTLYGASGPARGTPHTHSPSPAAPQAQGLGSIQNPLVKAAVASAARAASPALAAAGLVPQSVQNITQAELLSRRRAEAVMGMQDEKKE